LRPEILHGGLAVRLQFGAVLIEAGANRGLIGSEEIDEAAAKPEGVGHANGGERGGEETSHFEHPQE
jgi:hypothetical protein